MPGERSRGDITFESLQDFLRRIGFDQSARVSNSLAFHHAESGTMIVLSIPNDGCTVSSADMLSIVMRLENQGLVGESALGRIKAGKLPLAS